MKVIPIHIITEDVSYTPEKANEIISKYEKEFTTYQSQAERLYNILGGFSIGDLLEEGGEDKLEKISDTANKLYNKLCNDIHSKIMDVGDSFEEDYKGEIYTKCSELEHKYQTLYSHVFEIFDFAHKVRMVKENLKEDELDKLTKYKK